MDGNHSEDSISRDLRTSATNEVSDQYKDLAKTDPIAFIRECHKKFCQKKIEAFPLICEVARVQNMLKVQELRKEDSRGKYTESYGWSKDKTFKFDYEITEDLYQFMQNLVYDNFWSEENRPIWRKFMNKLCKGEDPKYLLAWVRSQYGNDQGLVTTHGL